MSAPRKLGRTGIDADPVTIGTSFLGAGTSPGTPEEDSAVDFATAILTGPFRLVDTSNNYADGRAEAVLGRALSLLDGRAHAQSFHLARPWNTWNVPSRPARLSSVSLNRSA